MKIITTSKEYNPLLKRKEITFEVNHEKAGGTPTRLDVRKELATLLKMDIDLVYIKKMTTKTGTRIAVGTANAYDSAEQAKLVESKHTLLGTHHRKNLKKLKRLQKNWKRRKRQKRKKK